VSEPKQPRTPEDPEAAAMKKIRAALMSISDERRGDVWQYVTKRLQAEGDLPADDEPEIPE
jgi:hypothetical protein